jgi:hypothetical protein
MLTFDPTTVGVASELHSVYDHNYGVTQAEGGISDEEPIINKEWPSG